MRATSGRVSIFSSVSVVGAPIAIVGAYFTLFFSLTTGIIKMLLRITRNKKKKHEKLEEKSENTRLNSVNLRS